MFFPFTVAATMLSLFSELPLLLQATKNAAVNASTAAALISLTVVCTVNRCSFKDCGDCWVAANLTIVKMVCYKFCFYTCRWSSPIERLPGFKLRRYHISWQNVAKSAEKARNSETMFLTQTIERRGVLIQTCNPFAYNFQKVAPKESRFVPAVSRPVKLRRPLNTYYSYSQQPATCFRSSRRFLHLSSQSNRFDFHARISRQTSRCDSGAGRRFVAEKLSVNFVHRSEFFHVHEKYRCLNDTI